MKIKLNNEISIDLEKLLDSKMLIQANSGGGKSWAIRRILEQSHGKVQQIVIDLEGEFSTLREKFDYILAGKDGDVQVSVKSAALLARRLLELNVSAIIDLYELPHHDRKAFVRLFLDSMVNAPKELWHPCMVIIDEAHVFVPEKGESEAANSVIDLMSRGRKRGFCGILATQRISKLHKDAAAECNNKLIGRTGLDIDMKRAADELGFNSKEQVMSLRKLAPGEFYVYGTAISDEVIKTKIGEVSTMHIKSGAKSGIVKSPPAPEKIRKILGQLADLPKEAEQEAKTVFDLKREISEKNKEISDLKKNPMIDSAKHEKLVEHQLQSVRNTYERRLTLMHGNQQRLKKYLEQLVVAIKTAIEKPLPNDILDDAPVNNNADLAKGNKTSSEPADMIHFSKLPDLPISDHKSFEMVNEAEDRRRSEILKKGMTVEYAPIGDLGKGERIVLIAIAQYGIGGMTREHITVVTGYKRSSRDAYIQRLKSRNYIGIGDDGKLCISNSGIEVLGNDYQPLPTGEGLRDHLMTTLPEGEKKILHCLIENYPESVPRETLSELTGYQRSSRDAYIQRLNARALIEFEGRGMVKASEKLFD